MASILIVGEEPCTISKMINIISESSTFPDLRPNLQTFARILGLPEEVVVELELKKELNVEQLQRSLFHLLLSWTENCGNNHTMEHLCRALKDCDAATIADKLKEELTKELNTRFGGVYEPASMKISDIFRSPPGNNRLGRNDPVQMLRNCQIPVRLVPLPRIVEHLVGQLDKQEVKNQEDLIIRRLFPSPLADIVGTPVNFDEEKAEQLFRTMNLTNWGRNYVAWFVAARVILGYATVNMSEWKLKVIANYIFGVENPSEMTCCNQKSYVFKRQLLVYFIDWWVGSGGYEFPFNFGTHWGGESALACFKFQLVNLTNHILKLPELLHSLVENTKDASRLEDRVSVILSVMNENAGSVNSLNRRNRPPLLMRRIHVELIDLLMYAGSNVHAVNEKGQNFVHVAASDLPSEQFHQLVRYLVDRRLTHLLNARDSDHKTPLFNLFNNYGSNPYPCTLQLLASAGVDFNVTDKNGESVLFYAIRSITNDEVFRTLIEIGADWKCTSSDNSTLLHTAVHMNNLEVVKYLVGLGCDVNARDNGHKTPLMYYPFHYIDVFKYLLEHGADVNAADKYGNTVLDRALELNGNAEIFETLGEHGADWKTCRSSNNRNLLHVACRKGHSDVVKYLVGLGFDVNARDNNLNTPIIHAVAGADHFHGNQDIVRFLLESGADSTAANRKGHTAFYYALIKGLDVYKILTGEQGC